jgi:hypothetical protein
VSFSIHLIEDLSQASRTKICLQNSWGESDKKSKKEFAED